MTEAGAFNEQKTKSKKKANQTKKILCVYAYIDRQYVFFNPSPCNQGLGEPNLHILQASLQYFDIIFSIPNYLLRMLY